MIDKKFTNYRLYYNFLNTLANDLTKFYYKKLDRPFRVINKNKKKGYDPVTQADREFEKFIRLKIKKKFPNHQVCLLYTSPSPRDRQKSRMPSSA